MESFDAISIALGGARDDGEADGYRTLPVSWSWRTEGPAEMVPMARPRRGHEPTTMAAARGN